MAGLIFDGPCGAYYNPSNVQPWRRVTAEWAGCGSATRRLGKIEGDLVKPEMDGGYEGNHGNMRWLGHIARGWG